MPNCATVTIAFTAQDGSHAALCVPAYTRSRDSFLDELAASTRVYLTGATITGTQLSIGDFAMWLLRGAATEPHTQETQG